MSRYGDLSDPRGVRTNGASFRPDPDSFGRFSEAVARVIGTARFLVWQTVICVTWIVLNLPGSPFQFDGGQLQLLTLGLSLQAAYAAPLILLAQDRQQTRASVRDEKDRDDQAILMESVSFIARELADVRRSVNASYTEETIEQIVRSTIASMELAFSDPVGVERSAQS